MITPVKISIIGDFIDSQIYNGKLYLWHFNGKLSIYDWNRLIERINKDANNKDINIFSLKYNKISEINDEIKNSIIEKFKQISNTECEISDIEDYKIFETESPTGILPIDTEIHNNVLYCLTEKGLFSSQTIKTNKSKQVNKITDIKAFSIKANKDARIVISAGDDGVYEYYINDNIDKNTVLRTIDKSVYQVSDHHSTFANYVNRSIYSTSLVRESMFLDYGWNNREKVFVRKPNADIESSNLFGDNTGLDVSWGVNDKIFKISNKNIKIRRVSNINKKNMTVDSFDIQDKLGYGNVISANATHFGTIIEYENALLVKCSNNEEWVIKEEIVNWRIFPRSKCYQNQMHVILNDRIEIYSFNHDYFIDQKHNQSGI